MSLPKKTEAEKRALSEERGKHLDWLAGRGMREPPWLLRSEDAYTGLLLVTSYHQFGSVLRAAYDRGVPGLVPLLVGLYAGLSVEKPPVPIGAVPPLTAGCLSGHLGWSWRPWKVRSGW
jgi:hypothetical protein